MVAADLAVFFLIGLLGGAHCIGMCGPIVTMYSGRLAEHSSSRRGHLGLYEVRQHLLFNVGRTVGYAVIGGTVGFLGGLLLLTSEGLAGVADLVHGSVGILVGLAVMGMGVYYLFGAAGGLGGKLRIPGASRVTGVLVSRVDGWVGGPGIVGLGALHGLLPCPILYPAFLYAFASGSAVTGVVGLAALGVGTIPAVLLYGTVIESVDPVNRHRMHRVLGVLFIALGYIPLSHGLMAAGIHLPHPPIPYYQPFAGGLHVGF